MKLHVVAENSTRERDDMKYPEDVLRSMRAHPSSMPAKLEVVRDEQ